MSLDLDSGVPDGAIGDKWHNWLDSHKLVGPRNRNEYRVIVVGTGLAGASAASTLAGHGLPGRVLLLPGLRPAGALDRRPGRDQRDQGLRQRGRLGPPPVRRHDQGRRLPRPRGERLAAGRALDRDHRPGGRPGGALQPRVRRHARHALFGGVLVERTFYCRGQTGQQLLLGAYQALQKQVRRRARRGSTPATRCSTSSSIDGEARGIVARDLVTGEIEAPRRRRGRARQRRLLQRLLPLDQREELQRDRDLARAQARRRVRQPVLHPDPPDLHPAVGRLPVEADPDERVAAQRRAHLGPEGPRRGARPGGHPRRGPPLLPGGALPPLRQPRAARRRLAAGEDRLRRGPRRRARPGAGSTSTSATRSRTRAPRRSRAATGTCSRCTSGSPATPRGRRR